MKLKNHGGLRNFWYPNRSWLLILHQPLTPPALRPSDYVIISSDQGIYSFSSSSSFEKSREQNHQVLPTNSKMMLVSGMVIPVTLYPPKDIARWCSMLTSVVSGGLLSCVGSVAGLGWVVLLCNLHTFVKLKLMDIFRGTCPNCSACSLVTLPKLYPSEKMKRNKSKSSSSSKVTFLKIDRFYM